MPVTLHLSYRRCSTDWRYRDLRIGLKRDQAGFNEGLRDFRFAQFGSKMVTSGSRRVKQLLKIYDCLQFRRACQNDIWCITNIWLSREAIVLFVEPHREVLRMTVKCAPRSMWRNFEAMLKELCFRPPIRNSLFRIVSCPWPTSPPWPPSPGWTSGRRRRGAPASAPERW